MDITKRFMELPPREDTYLEVKEGEEVNLKQLLENGFVTIQTTSGFRIQVSLERTDEPGIRVALVSFESPGFGGTQAFGNKSTGFDLDLNESDVLMPEVLNSGIELFGRRHLHLAGILYSPYMK